MKGGPGVLFRKKPVLPAKRTRNSLNQPEPAFYTSLPDKEGTCYQII